jgi:enterochelin esterase-like enzyme
MINTGQIRPLIVAMPGYTAITPSLVVDDLLDAIIPYVESHYAVSKSPSERAMAGLSRGSGLTNQL